MAMDGKARAWLAVGAWAAVIFALSSRPGPVVPFEFFPHQDKLGHFIQYFVLGALLHRAMGGSRCAAILAVFIAAAYGVTDEFHQSFVPDRVVSAADLCADTLGAAFAQIVIIAGRVVAR